MKSRVLLFLSALALSAATSEIAGRWETVMVDPAPGSGRSPLLRYEPTVEFTVEGNKLTGVAHVEGWPGDAPLSDGNVDGDHITFSLFHEQSYSTRGGTFYPKFRCVGTIHGAEMDLAMFHAPFNGSNVESDRWEMKGNRVIKRID